MASPCAHARSLACTNTCKHSSALIPRSHHHLDTPHHRQKPLATYLLETTELHNLLERHHTSSRLAFSSQGKRASAAELCIHFESHEGISSMSLVICGETGRHFQVLASSCLTGLHPSSAQPVPVILVGCFSTANHSTASVCR